MVTVVLGLGSALGYALHDFLMVKIVRAAAVWTALTWSMAVGVAILVPLALVLDGPPSGAAEWRAAGFAAASGVCEAAGLGCLLRGLVVGNLSVVTPLASLAGGFVAVIMIVQGEPLPALAAIGLPLAVAGGLMASVEMAPKEELFGPDGAAAPARRTRATAGAGWALLSSALFSVTILLFVEAGALHPVTLAAYGRLGTMVVLVPATLLLAGLRMPRGLLRRSAYAGLCDAAAFVALASAISIGPVAIASVACAQGGTMAAILGFVMLHERLSRVQIAGVTLTCVAVALLATG